MFTIIVEHAEYDSSGGSVVTIGKLRMVDLAGSERLEHDHATKTITDVQSTDTCNPI